MTCGRGKTRLGPKEVVYNLFGGSPSHVKVLRKRVLQHWCQCVDCMIGTWLRSIKIEESLLTRADNLITFLPDFCLRGWGCGRPSDIVFGIRRRYMFHYFLHHVFSRSQHEVHSQLKVPYWIEVWRFAVVWTTELTRVSWLRNYKHSTVCKLLSAALLVIISPSTARQCPRLRPRQLPDNSGIEEI